MVDHFEPRWRIGQVSARTGLTARTLRYYEELGLLRPSERSLSGHRVYGNDDLQRLYRISLLRQLGLPLSDIARELTEPSDELSDTITRHVGQVDQRLAALGRYDGVATGEYDDATRAALGDFAGEYNLEGRLRDDDLISQLLVREIRDITPELDA